MECDMVMLISLFLGIRCFSLIVSLVWVLVLFDVIIIDEILIVFLYCCVIFSVFFI